ncbi:MAG: STAS domain-containing protein [Lachnospiraceae bacterium]|jgi:anti-sigma B factor antagonist|nr:STAS domain-containing protein [Lachnospiraceae bacterium]
MDYSITKDDDTLNVKLFGRLDTNNSTKFENAIMGEMTGVSEVVFDFGELNYISSAGLRVLVLTDQTLKEGNGIKIINLKEELRDVFEVTGLIDLFEFE